MIRKVIGVAFLAAGIIAPLAASAQGVPGGVNVGPAKGERAAGPVGAIVAGSNSTSAAKLRFALASR